MGKELTVRHKKYVKGIVEGKSKQQSAIDAGFARATAKNAYDKVETGGVKEAIEKALDRAGVTTERIADKVNEGLEAKKIHTSHTEPDAIVPDFAVQHKYLETAIKLRGIDKDAPTQVMNFVQIIQNDMKQYHDEV